jgi:branched-chain amino acid transport system ATP-binding protein
MTEPGRHAADRGDDSAQDDSAQDGVQEEAVRNDAVDEPLPPVAAPTAPADVAAPATGETPILASVDLVAGYIPGVNILNGCNVHVNKGELVGIIGPNGAGKSTLIKAMFGLVPVRGGAVMLGEDNISALPAHTLVGRGLGYVPQNNNVFPSLTVEENLQMGLYLRPKEYRTRYQVITEMFPVLHERRTQKCGSLSGGERQVVAMGRALMTDPTVLFLDEPSAGLSPLMQDSVFASIKTINESGVSILMVEQNARSCLEISHRGYVLDQGKDAYTGTGRDLLNDPKVIELYLGTLARVAQ